MNGLNGSGNDGHSSKLRNDSSATAVDAATSKAPTTPRDGMIGRDL